MRKSTFCLIALVIVFVLSILQITTAMAATTQSYQSQQFNSNKPYSQMTPQERARADAQAYAQEAAAWRSAAPIILIIVIPILYFGIRAWLKEAPNMAKGFAMLAKPKTNVAREAQS